MTATSRSPTTVDVRAHHVTLLDGPDARRRACEDQVACLQLEQGREKRDLVGDVPDHLVEIAGLLALAVDVEPDRPLGRVLHAFGRHQRRAGGGVLERLGHLPRTRQLLGDVLQVAARHVDADAIAEHVAHRLLRLDVHAARLQRDDQLHLEMHIARVRRVGELAITARAVGILLEEERGVLGVATHLLGVLRVVAANAIDAMDRKQLVGAFDGQRGQRGWGERIGHAN